jgi:hypothetical protein
MSPLHIAAQAVVDAHGANGVATVDIGRAVQKLKAELHIDAAINHLETLLRDRRESGK